MTALLNNIITNKNKNDNRPCENWQLERTTTVNVINSRSPGN